MPKSKALLDKLGASIRKTKEEEMVSGPHRGGSIKVQATTKEEAQREAQRQAALREQEILRQQERERHQQIDNDIQARIRAAREQREAEEAAARQVRPPSPQKPPARAPSVIQKYRDAADNFASHAPEIAHQHSRIIRSSSVPRSRSLQKERPALVEEVRETIDPNFKDEDQSKKELAAMIERGTLDPSIYEPSIENKILDQERIRRELGEFTKIVNPRTVMGGLLKHAKENTGIYTTQNIVDHYLQEANKQAWEKLSPEAREKIRADVMSDNLDYIDNGSEGKRENFVSPLPELNETGAGIGGQPLYMEEAKRALLKKAFNEANKPFPRYGAPRVASLDPEEVRAYEYLVSENPVTNPDIRAQEKAIMDNLNTIQKEAKSSGVSRPMIEAMMQNPARMHEELMGPEERAHLSDLEKRMNRNFYEKTLPELRRKYLVPGLHRSGHMNKSVRDAVESHTRGLTEALNEARMGNKRATLGVGQGYAGTLGQAGKLAAENATADVQQSMQATNMLQNAFTAQRDLRRQSALDLGNIGSVKRGINQQQLSALEAEALREAEHPMNQLKTAAAIQAGLPTSTMQLDPNQLRGQWSGQPNSFHAIGQGLAGMAAGAMNRERRKKGGAVGSRVKKADGGNIMSESNMNAVMDHEDPLTALRRLMNRQRMMDMYQTKAGRRKYKLGGMVNPIQAGAEQAREFVGEKKLREHIESKSTIRQKPQITSMIDDFMTGMSGAAGSSPWGNMAKSYSNVAGNKEAAMDMQELERQKDLESLYALDEDAMSHQAAQQKAALEEIKHQLQEKKEEAREREAIRRNDISERRAIASENATNTRLDLMSKSLTAKGKEPLKLDKTEHEVMSNAANILQSKQSILNQIHTLRDLVKKPVDDKGKEGRPKIQTGKISAALGLSHGSVQEALGHGPRSKIELFNKIAGMLANLEARKGGGRIGPRLIELMQRIKPGLDLSNEGNMEVLDEMEKAIIEDAEMARHIVESKKQGIAPTEALYNRDMERLNREESSSAAASPSTSHVPTANPKNDLNSKINSLDQREAELMKALGK